MHPPSDLGGEGVKNFRNVFAEGEGGMFWQRELNWRGGGDSRSFEVQIKIA